MTRKNIKKYLTKKKIKEHLKRGCPTWQETGCSECGLAWTDVYAMNRIKTH
jgi:hypothetical protein